MNQPEVKILIACHPRAFFRNQNRWMPDHFESTLILTEMNRTFPYSRKKFETLDLNSVPPPRTPSTYKANMFDAAWVRAHPNEWNAIWLPDCGGEWFHMFQLLEVGDIDTFSYDLERILTKLLKQLKPGGKLYLGKILMPDKELFASIIYSLALSKLIPPIEGLPEYRIFNTLSPPSYGRPVPYNADYVIIQKKI